MHLFENDRMGSWFTSLEKLPPELLSPWALALLGLAVGSFLNVVVHRLPLMMERQWWSDVASQLTDADSFRRVFAAPAPEPLAQAGGKLATADRDAGAAETWRGRRRAARSAATASAGTRTSRC